MKDTNLEVWRWTLRATPRLPLRRKIQKSNIYVSNPPRNCRLHSKKDSPFKASMCLAWLQGFSTSNGGYVRYLCQVHLSHQAALGQPQWRNEGHQPGSLEMDTSGHSKATVKKKIQKSNIYVSNPPRNCRLHSKKDSPASGNFWEGWTHRCCFSGFFFLTVALEWPEVSISKLPGWCPSFRHWGCPSAAWYHSQKMVWKVHLAEVPDITPVRGRFPCRSHAGPVRRHHGFSGAFRIQPLRANLSCWF